jgi:hypothetical protein
MFPHSVSMACLTCVVAGDVTKWYQSVRVAWPNLGDQSLGVTKWYQRKSCFWSSILGGRGCYKMVSEPWFQH